MKLTYIFQKCNKLFTFFPGENGGAGSPGLYGLPGQKGEAGNRFDALGAIQRVRSHGGQSGGGGGGAGAGGRMGGGWVLSIYRYVYAILLVNGRQNMRTMGGVSKGLEEIKLSSYLSHFFIPTQ